METFITHLEAKLKEGDQIVRIKIENSSSKQRGIAIEPWGSGDDFPSGAVYEIVTAGNPKAPILHIDVKDNMIFVYAMTYNEVTIFNNGTATLAHS